MEPKPYCPVPANEKRLPVDEIIKKPFQWPKSHLDVANIKWNKDKQNCGGRTKKGITPLRIKILAELEKQQWTTCLDLAVELNCKRKTVQECIKAFYENGVLIRRRKTPHEYEYALAELPKQPR